MKRFGGIGMAVLLFVLLGATAFGYAQGEQQNENQGKPEKQKGKLALNRPSAPTGLIISSSVMP